MSGKAGVALLTAGLVLLSCSVLAGWPFWTEALAFAILFTGMRLLLPLIENRYEKRGRWIYWGLLGTLLLLVYFRWFT